MLLFLQGWFRVIEIHVETDIRLRKYLDVFVVHDVLGINKSWGGARYGTSVASFRLASSKLSSFARVIDSNQSYLDNKYDPPLLVGPLCLHTATRVYQCETVFAVLNQVHAEGYTHTLRCAGVYTIMADFFPSKRRASDPYMVTVRRLAYALQRVTHPTCSPVATRSPSVLFSCFYPQYLGVYVCDSRIDFSPSQLRISRVGLRHTHHPGLEKECSKSLIID